MFRRLLPVLPLIAICVGCSDDDSSSSWYYGPSDASQDQSDAGTTDAGLDVVGVRRAGMVVGYLERRDTRSGVCGERAHTLSQEQILPQSAGLREVIEVLTREKLCFVSTVGQVGAVIHRTNLQRPPVRMWLFGMVTILEMYLNRSLEDRFPDESWCDQLSRARLAKAEALLAERRRRRQTVRLLAPDGSEIARGITNYNAGDLAAIQGHQSHDIPAVLGYQYGPTVVHRDDMVLL